MSYIGSKRSSSLVSFDEGTIGSGVVFPAGHVIRYLEAIYDGATTDTSVNNSWEYWPNLVIDVIPASQSSKFLLIANLHTKAGGLYKYLGCAIKITSPVDAEISGRMQVSQGDNNGYALSMTLVGYYHPNTTSQCTFKVGYIDTEDASTIYFNTSGQTSTAFTSRLSLLEFAG